MFDFVGDKLLPLVVSAVAVNAFEHGYFTSKHFWHVTVLIFVDSSTTSAHFP